MGETYSPSNITNLTKRMRPYLLSVIEERIGSYMHRAASDLAVAGTVVPLNQPIQGLSVTSGWLGIGQYTPNYEVRKPLAIAGANYTVGALARTHTEGDICTHNADTVLNALWFDSKGDDSTDNSTAFANALGEINAIGGGALYLPDGIYRYSTTPTVYSNTTIFGSRNAILKPTTPGMHILQNSDQIVGNDRIFLQGFTIDGSVISTDITAGALRFIKVNDFRVMDCKFTTIPRNALNCDQLNWYWIENNYFNNIGSAEDNDPPNIGCGMYVTQSTHGVITHNEFYDVWQIPIYVLQSSSDCIIDANVIDTVFDNGIRLAPTDTDIIVSNNILRDVGTQADAIRLNGNRVSAINNKVMSATLMPEAGIKVEEGIDIMISDNTLEGCKNGIYLRATGDILRCQVGNNNVQGGNNGIVMVRIAGTETLSNIDIHDNIVRDCTVNGIDAGVISVKIDISNNKVSGCGDKGIYCLNNTSLTVMGNHTISNTGAGITIDNASRLVVESNISSENGSNGINITNSDTMTVSGNVSYLNTANGLRINASDDITLGNNTCRNNNDQVGDNEDGIALVSCTNITVGGNRCVDDRGTQYQKYGLRVTGGDSIKIFGNDFTGNATGEYLIAGGATNVQYEDFVSRYARVYNSTDFTHNSTGNWLAITFDSERWDTAAMHSTVTNTSRLTAPVNGWYEIGGNVQFATNATGTRVIRIYMDGTTGLAIARQNPTSGYNVQMNINCQYYLTAGQYVELQAYQDSGGNLAVTYNAGMSPEFWMALIKREP